jgi:putative transposase
LGGRTKKEFIQEYLREPMNKGHMRRILKAVGVSVGGWYGKRQKKANPAKRGPKVTHSDQEIVQAVKSELNDPTFYNEGYIKLTKRLRAKSIKVSKERLQRIMKASGLLLDAPNRIRKTSYQHTGSILKRDKNEMWGTDVKELKSPIGKMYFIGVIDHYHNKIVGHIVSRHQRSKETIEALHIAVRKEYGGLHKEVCKQSGLQIRLDNGSQFVSKLYKKEMEFLGITMSPTMVRSPQSNGLIERFHGILQDQLRGWETVTSLEMAQQKVSEFVDRYNDKWLIHRLGLQSPNQYELHHAKPTNIGFHEARGVPSPENIQSTIVDAAEMKKSQDTDHNDQAPGFIRDNFGTSCRPSSSHPHHKDDEDPLFLDTFEKHTLKNAQLNRG